MITRKMIYVYEHERNYGNISVIPFFFPTESQSYLLLLRQIYETIILYSMANVIKLRKGLDINLKGKAAETYATVKEPGFYALVPDDFPGVTPKVVVKEQEYVMAGGPLFIDKYHPEVKFVSPVSGVVTSVERGARRKVLNIVVEAAAEQDYEDFGKKNVASMDAEAVKSALLGAGLFAFIKQRPYDIIADPTVTPKGIFISAFDTNPLAPDFEFALKGEEANFQTGLDALAKLAKTYLNISVKQNAAALDRKIQLELAPPTPEVAEKENEGQQVKPEAEDVRNRQAQYSENAPPQIRNPSESIIPNHTITGHPGLYAKEETRFKGLKI